MRTDCIHYDSCDTANLSSCCGAERKWSDICSDCGEHSTDSCEDCEDYMDEEEADLRRAEAAGDEKYQFKIEDKLI